MCSLTFNDLTRLPRTVFFASGLYYWLVSQGLNEVGYLLLFVLRVTFGMITSPEPIFALIEKFLQLFFGVE
jgi:hypothetical protein